MTRTRTLLIAMMLIIPVTLYAQEPALNRVQAAPDADDTEMFIREFYKVLNQVANDYPSDFKNITGDEIQDEKSSSNRYYTTAALPEASEVYLTNRLEVDLQTVTTVYVAVFYDNTDAELANTIYENLVWLINHCSFDCCSMVYDQLDDSENSGSKTTFWLPYEYGDVKAYENMLLEVRLYNSFDITDDLEVVDTWSVVFNASTFVD